MSFVRIFESAILILKLGLKISISFLENTIAISFQNKLFSHSVVDDIEFLEINYYNRK